MVKSKGTIEGTVTLVLSETEARALNAMTVYGHESFLKMFYNKLGKSYMEPHESGAISLFDTIQKELPGHLKKFDKARKALEE